MNPRICLVVGDSNTRHCGVKDYAVRLGEALGNIGLSAEVLAPADWGVKSFMRFCEELRERQFEIVHIQYPSIGNRGSLGPHFLGMMRVAKRVVVTLHEYSVLPVSQRISTHLFRFTADQLLFTADAELTKYGRSWVTKRVIHIGSNVPAFSSDLPREPTVLYFGQIRPNKGIEEFLELARRSQQLGKPFKYRVIGSVPQRRAAYYATLRANDAPGVEWLIDLPFEQVAKQMATSLAAYLPFPDGASYRRGSLLAALSNGLPPMTTIGPATPRDMLDVLLPTCGAEEALEHLQWLSANPSEALAFSCAARAFAEKFSWPQIARQHELVYLEALSKAGPSRQRHYAASTSPYR